MAVIALISALAIGFGALGQMPAPAASLVCVTIVFLSIVGFYHGIRKRKPIHIDISATGDMRLAKGHAIEACVRKERPHVVSSGIPVRLLPNSTLWPHLLLLLLQTENGKTVVLPILPDSVTPDIFRALSAACLWISQHDKSPNRENP